MIYPGLQMLSKDESFVSKENKKDIKTEIQGEGLSSKDHSEGGVKKNLPQNLLNIFNQIAAFEKEKGNKPKN